MERRVLIAEGQSEFGLSMASILRDAGFHASLATSASEALREIERRRPHLVVIRAELPDQSGFVLCGRLRKAKERQDLPIILVSSDVGIEALEEHSRSPQAANAYLALPFEMSELTRLAELLAPQRDSEEPESDVHTLDSALGLALSETSPDPAEPTPEDEVSQDPAVAPPKLPRRGRRSALTEVDKQFIEDTFESIAGRKEELLAAAKHARRPDRKQLDTPEGRLQFLREELKLREVQIARISEVWSVRERELLSSEDRLSEKDVQIQGLKMMQEDLNRRLREAKDQVTSKEREHGKQVEDLLLQRFIGEKEVIEVVSAKEKEVSALRVQLGRTEEELGTRKSDLVQLRAEFDTFQKAHQSSTAELELRENKARELVAHRDSQLEALRGEYDTLLATYNEALSDRDTKYTEYTSQVASLTDELRKSKEEGSARIKSFEATLALTEERSRTFEADGKRLASELASTNERDSRKIAELTREVAQLSKDLAEERAAKAALDASSRAQREEQAAKYAAIERELGDVVGQKDRQEAELQTSLQKKMERIGELEGDLETTKAGAADKQDELRRQLQEAVASSEASAQAHSQQLAQVREELAAANANQSDLTQRLQQGASTIEGLRTSVQEREEKLAKVSTNLSDSQEAHAALQAQHQAKVSEHSQALGELEAVRSALTDTRAQLAQETDALEKTRAQLAEANAAHAQAQQSAREGRERLTAEFESAKLISTHAQETLQGELAKTKADLSSATGARSELEKAFEQAKVKWANQEADRDRAAEASAKEASSLRAQLAEARQESDLHANAAAKEQEKVHALQDRVSELLTAADARTVELSVGNAALEELTAKHAAALDQALQTAEIHKAVISDRDAARSQLEKSVERANELINEANSTISSERIKAKSAVAEAMQRAMKAEAQIVSERESAGSEREEMSQLLRSAQDMVTQRDNAIATLEEALETARAAVPSEELEESLRLAQVRAAEAEQRTGRMQQALEAKQSKDLQELHAKHRVDVERRDQLKAQEIRQLQEALQEKAKLLKIAEFEIARAKARSGISALPGHAPTAPSLRPRVEPQLLTSVKQPSGFAPPARAAPAEEAVSEEELERSLASLDIEELDG